MSKSRSWHMLTKWEKRLHGWACYQVASWLSLMWPEVVDRATYDTLREQFRSEGEGGDHAG